MASALWMQCDQALSYPFFILFFEKLNLKLLSQTWDRENERSFKFDYRMGKFWGGMFGFRKSRKENKDEKQKKNK